MSRRWLENLKELFTRERSEADLERELRSHLEAEVEEQLERGVPQDEARYAAIRALGNVPHIQEDTRASWKWGRLTSFIRDVANGMRQDLRYGLRGLVKQPGFTGTAVLALALGIGATTTMFSVIKNVLLDPYPMYADVDRIVGVSVVDTAGARPRRRSAFSVPELLDYQAQATSFEDVIAGTGEDVLYTSSEGTEQFRGGLTTGNTFTFMGVPAVVGRTLTIEDAKPGAPPVFVMSYKLWANRFGLDRGILGQTFTLNGVPTTLVGVMPQRVSKLGADLWKPVWLDHGDPALRDTFFMFQARLKRGVTIEQAQAELNVIGQRLAQEYPRVYPDRFDIEVRGLIDSIVGRFSTTLYTMAAAVGLLLLIACANVANMLLSRAAGREREMALRSSLGASRARLVRQLLVESLLLALGGMIVGCALSLVGIKLLAGAIPEGLIPRESVIRLDTTALIFSLVVAALTALVFGLAPALQTVRRDLVNPLRDAGKGTSGFRRARLSSALVVTEIALSLVLLTSAGLLMRSFIKLQTTDLGFDPGNLLLVRVAVGADQKKNPAAQRQFLAQVLSGIRAVPGVISASTTSGFPMFGGFISEFDVLGVSHSEIWRADIELCSDDYFRTLGTRILTGRDFSVDDLNNARHVSLVNQALVEQHLKDVNPVGRTMALKLRNERGELEDRTFEIIGVVADVKNNGVSEPVSAEIYLPYSAAPFESVRILARTAVPPLTLVSAVKQKIWSVDRGVAVADAEAVTAYLRQFAYAEPRLGLFVFGAFAAIGLVLVVLGVYSLVAYTVARQTREIGIRMAIGANRSDVLRMTIGMGIRWIGFGVIAGVLTSLATTRVLGSQLTEIDSTDPLTLASVVIIIAISGLAASYVPALRATRVDPIVVLRYE
jgi:putative ABC transport system permease protein